VGSMSFSAKRRVRAALLAAGRRGLGLRNRRDGPASGTPGAADGGPGRGDPPATNRVDQPAVRKAAANIEQSHKLTRQGPPLREALFVFTRSRVRLMCGKIVARARLRGPKRRHPTALPSPTLGVAKGGSNLGGCADARLSVLRRLVVVLRSDWGAGSD
jgi:hypothetical protein